MKALANKIFSERKMLFSLAAISIIFLFLFGPLNHYLLKSLYESNYYHLGVPSLVAAYLAVRGFKDGKEMKILIIYVAWAVITRVLNGDRFLLVEGDYLIDLSTMILLFAPGLLLQGEKRRKIYTAVAIVVVIFYFAAALICIYSAATRTYLENPIDFRGIGYPNLQENRLNFLSFQYNETAGQFVIAFGMCMLLLFSIKQPVIRAVLILAALADFAAVSLTLSRNGQSCVCIISGLAFGILVVNGLSKKKLGFRVAGFIITFIFSAMVIYQLFEPVRYGAWVVYQNQKATESSKENEIHAAKGKYYLTETGMSIQVTELSAANSSSEYRADERNYFESGRKQIFWSAFKSLQLEPKRLLIGSGYYHVMDHSHKLITEQAKHFHNTFLQVVNEYGVIGLFLVLLFYWKTIIISIYMVFCPDGRVKLNEQMMILVPCALMFYYMLEVGIFKIVDMADFRNTFFFFSCGMLTGTFQELKRRNA